MSSSISRGITAGRLLFAGATAGVALSVAGPLWALCWTVPTAVCAFLAGRRPGRTRHTALALLAVLAAGVLAIALVPAWIVLGSRFVAVLVCAAMLPWFAGRFWRQYQELVRAGWERAAHLEREQRLVAEQARLRERARIAQDVHDALGHDLSLIALSAGALKLAPGLSDAHRAAAQDIRAKAGAAVERLGEVVGVLRHEGAAGEPPDHGVADVVARVRAAGLAVELSVTGDPEAAPPMTERAVRRVVQESLTNVAKHAPGATAAVRVRHTAAATEVRVTNGPPPPVSVPDPVAEPAAEPAAGGFGLIGLDERVRLTGGTLSFGPTDPGDPPHPGTAHGIAGETRPDRPAADAGHHAAHRDRPGDDTPEGPDSTGESDGRVRSHGTATRLPQPADRGVPGLGAAGTGFAVVATLPHTVPAGDRSARASGPAGDRPAGGPAPRPARALRRTLLAAVTVPLVTAVLLGGALIAWEAVMVGRSVLAPDDYASLRIGQDRAEIAHFLPDRQSHRRPAAAEPEQPGTACEYYDMTADRFDNRSGDVYRLCFRDGALVSADAFTGNAVR
ncbi:histidine kinase [Streptomyces sp. B6B3]|uniref:ATP-binding protein n=1 Tax=Streptomyces sp. B6B3 TaxID=3153570 RepID=UPI00325D90B6